MEINIELLKPDKIRILIELIVEKIPLSEDFFLEEDKYHIFFPITNIRKGDRMRIYSLKRVVWFTCLSFFGKRIEGSDLDLILNFELASHDFKTLKSAFSPRKNNRYATLHRHLISEMKKDAEMSSLFWIEELRSEEGSVVSVRSDGKDISIFIPKEQSDFVEKIFHTIEQKTGFPRDVITDSSRVRAYATIRCVALTIFFRRYPNSSENILGYIVGRSRNGASGMLRKIYEYYFNKKFAKDEDVVDFLNLFRKVTLQLKIE
jgi:hypothetical protein